MKFNVTFRSTYPINEVAEPVGEELADYFAEAVRRAGIDVAPIDNYEDFAWIIETGPQKKGPYILLGCIGDGDFEWLAQIYSGIGLIGKLLDNTDVDERANLAHLVHQLLVSDRRFSAIRWHENGYGPEGWSPAPA